MKFTLFHLRAFQLAVIVTSTIFYSTCADLNPKDVNNKSFVDILSDASCPNFHNGRLSIDNCHGYVDCMNGFEIDRAICQEGKLFSIRTENCEPKESVPVCSGVPLNDSHGNDRTSSTPKSCGNGLCVKPDGGCGVMHQCLINPCDMTPCKENQECVPSYCGGCHATCTLKLNVVDQQINDGVITTKPPPTMVTRAPIKDGDVSPRPPSTTTTPELIDDGGSWVPDGGSRTTTTSPQIVHDGNDAVARSSTTVAPEPTKTIIVVDPTPASSQEYIPSWSEHTCVANNNDSKNKKKRRLGSTWRASYPTRYECCLNNFLYSLELFKSCVGFDLDTLEPPSGGDDVDYYPLWNESKCQASEGTEDGWLQTTFRPKKYLCCFEYFKWDFDNCLKA